MQSPVAHEFLTFFPAVEERVLVCSSCQSAVVNTGLDTHLKRHHKLSAEARKPFTTWASQFTYNAPRDVQPAYTIDNQPPITYTLLKSPITGLACTQIGCKYATAEKTIRLMRDHCTQEHQWQAEKPGRHGKFAAPPMWRTAKVQTFFQDSINKNYFEVRTTDTNTTILPPSNTEDIEALELLKFQQAFKEEDEANQLINEQLHLSEVTPWQRRTGFQAHLKGLTYSDVTAAYDVPTIRTDPILAQICQSMESALQKGVAATGKNIKEGRLSRLARQHLKSEEAGRLSQNLFFATQNDSSVDKYFLTWRRCISYIYRVHKGSLIITNDDGTSTPLFILTDKQKQWLQQSIVLAEELQDDPEDLPLVKELERATIKLTMALMRHQLLESPFESPIISFCAALCVKKDTKGFLTAHQFSPFFSHIIYALRICLVQYSVMRNEQENIPIQQTIKDNCALWLNNGSEGPAGEILSERLYAIAITGKMAPEVKVRWDDERETVTYKHNSISMTEIRKLIRYSFEQASKVLKEELLFSITPPAIDLKKDIRDIYSVLEQGSNLATHFKSPTSSQQYQQWLYQQVLRTPSLCARFFNRTSSTDHNIILQAQATYELSIQSFLKHFLVLTHIGAGPSARGTEILSTKHSVRDEVRNVFLDGDEIEIEILYNKSQARTDYQKSVSRYLAPAVSQLLVSFITFIQPFRLYLYKATHIDIQLTSLPFRFFLWSTPTKVWDTIKLTATLQESCTICHITPINTRDFRQILKACCRMHFIFKEFDTLAPETDAEGEDAVGYHDLQHHSATTGNQIYGNSIKGGDARAWDFKRKCRKWWSFFYEPQQPTESKKHAREKSITVYGSDLKRPAVSNQSTALVSSSSIQKLRWDADTVDVGFTNLYGNSAAYRSSQQREAIQQITRGVKEIVVILSTGEGKSLLFMLPATLPDARTTLVIVPLIALKTDLLRRCEELNISCSVWRQDTLQRNTSIVFVTTESAAFPSFLTYAQGLYLSQQLDRIVIDECHLILTDSNYRPAFNTLSKLRAIDCQILCLSATLPASLSEEFTSKMMLPNAIFIRGITIRHNLQLNVVETGLNYQFEVYAYVKLQDLAEDLQEHQRMIVFVDSREEARYYASPDQLDCLYYTAHSQHKEQLVERWLNGDKQIIVATSAFSLGISYPHVSVIAHVRAPRGGIIRYTQEIGRGGRAGEACSCIIILPHLWRQQNRTAASFNANDVQMHKFLTTNSCRRAILSQYFDDKDTTCLNVQARCDNCRNPPTIDLSTPIIDPEILSTTIASGSTTGRSLLLEQAAANIQDRATYIQKLQQVVGSCGLCYISDRRLAASHQLNKCSLRFSYYDAKKVITTACRKNKSTEWFPTGQCFECYNPQIICDSTKEDIKDACLFKDIVLPICFSGFQNTLVRYSLLLELGFSEEGTEEQYMWWLGKSRRMFDISASNAVAACYMILRRIVDSSK